MISEDNEKDLTPSEEVIVDKIPQVLPVLPLRDTVIFPYMIFPVLVGREQSIRAANYSVEKDNFIFLAAQKDSSIDNPTLDEIHTEGTVAKIVQINKLPNGLLKIVVDGLLQGKIIEYTDNNEFIEAKVEVTVVNDLLDTELSALMRQLTNLFKEYVKVNSSVPPESIPALEAIEEPDRRLFYCAANLNQSIANKQKILSTFDIKKQYYQVNKLLKSEIDIIKIEKEIDHQVQESIAKSQRRFIIQEQIKVLQEELGDEDTSDSEITKLQTAISDAKMPRAVIEKATEELSKLRKMPPLSAEYTVIRNYLDWLLAVPWHKKTKDKLDIQHVKEVLDQDHYGLVKPKERILEHIAVLNLVKTLKGQILCLVGPPGVGKTSLGKSIARALGREFVRFSLGGVRDEAEIRGHRRTYIGSLPGKIIQSMKRAKTVNPVILLDEIDKLSSDFRGDPSSALLEVLDPEQNNTFSDHYLEVDYDLSNVLFITTANVRWNIPLPLQDRMEIIELSGYLETEKIEIAKRHLIPKQLKATGLDKKKVIFSDEAIKRIINDYTREAGVRNMEREIASIGRKLAKTIVADKSKEKTKQYEIDEKKIEELLGVSRFKSQKLDLESKVGSVNGLAWTSVGGSMLRVEVVIMAGKEKLTLTGQLGNVMKESATAALSMLRSKADIFTLPKAFFKNREIHIHLPEGAIPKDGPSAGITLVMAMVSALTGVPASGEVAMTGEITLRGDVLAIGGLTEKLLAAKRHGIKKVLIPIGNEPDLKEMEAEVKGGIQIIPITNIEEALPHVFVKWESRKKEFALKKKLAKEKKGQNV